jgi:hypothetical protein
MQILAYQLIAFTISVIFLIAVNYLNDTKPTIKNETKYIGATPEELDEILDTLYTESCFYPFDHFEDVV